MHKKREDMDEKSTRNSGKVKDVEVDMIGRSIRMKEGGKTSKDVEDVTIERSIRMKEGAKTKIQDKLIV